jgi:Uma2 family endonuclease
VLSPSNTKAQIQEEAALCLSTGTQEFWVADAKKKTITVTPKGGISVVYRIGDRIPFPMFDSYLDVADVFAA